MSTVLTNGIIIPDNGSRNWGGDLANNWNILDVNVGYMTDVKISVTRLENSVAENTANIQINASNISALQTSKQNALSDQQIANIADVTNKANDSDVVHKTGDETISGNKTWSGLNTFQQNITYARTNFFHQAVSPCYILKDTELEKGSLASTHTAYPGLWQDKNNNILGYVRFVEYSSGRQTAEFRLSNLIKDGALDPTGSEVNCTVNLELQPSGAKSLIPELNNDINLGTSTNKWKTLNGINPGALSLPDYTQSVTLSFAINSPLEVPFDGFIRIQLNVSNYSYIVIYVNNQAAHIGQSALKSTLTAFIPVSQNDVVKINVTDGEYAGHGNVVLFKNKGNS